MSSPRPVAAFAGAVAAFAATLVGIVPAAAGTAAAAPPVLRIDDVTLVVGDGSAPLAHRSLLLRDGRIAAIVPAGAALPGSRGARRIDGRGRYAMPGMMDVHIHLAGGVLAFARDPAAPAGYDDAAALRALQGYLHAGFTSVYDAGNAAEFIYPLRERERRGEILAPRIFATGRYLTWPGSWGAQPGGVALGTPLHDGAALRDDLEAQLRGHPDLQKLVYESGGLGPNAWIPSMPQPVLRATIAWLHEHGVRTTVHVSTEAAAREALDAGIDSFAHTPAVGALSKDFVARVAAARVPLVSSMVVFDEIVQLGAGTAYLDGPDYVALMSAEDRRGRAASREAYLRTGWPAWFAAIQPYLRQNVRRLHEAGAILALGTDKSHAPLALRELELLAEAGIPAADVLTIATRNAAIYLGVADRLGTLEVGKAADLLLLRADPTEDVRNVRAIEAVIKAGAIVDRSRLDVPANRPAATRAAGTP